LGFRCKLNKANRKFHVIKSVFCKIRRNSVIYSLIPLFMLCKPFNPAYSRIPFCWIFLLLLLCSGLNARAQKGSGTCKAVFTLEGKVQNHSFQTGSMYTHSVYNKGKVYINFLCKLPNLQPLATDKPALLEEVLVTETLPMFEFMGESDGPITNFGQTDTTIGFTGKLDFGGKVYKYTLLARYEFYKTGFNVRSEMHLYLADFGFDVPNHLNNELIGTLSVLVEGKLE
jgi:hypothetical protein